MNIAIIIMSTFIKIQPNNTFYFHFSKTLTELFLYMIPDEQKNK